MRTTEAYAKLLKFGNPILTTREASGWLRVGNAATMNLLRQLAKHGLVVRVRRGLWGIAGQLNPYDLPAHLTVPYPSYVSLWTALYHHGMIAQIPRIIYLVSLDRPKRIKTSIATYEVHRINAELFGGFAVQDHAKIAVPEKALFDTVYILGIRGKRSLRLPELELPSAFNEAGLKEWILRIPSRRLRTLTEAQLVRVVAQAKVGAEGPPISQTG